MKSITLAFRCWLVAPVCLLALPGLAQTVQKDINWYITHAPFPMASVQAPSIPARTFNILDYGAVGDGQTLNTTAFSKAIEACAAAGGGRVIVPEGLWLTGPIQLRSNIDLHLERSALVLFSRDHQQYPLIHLPDKGNREFTASPISGYNLFNIAITGEGIFDGGGDSWRPVKKNKTTAAQWKELLSSGGVLSRDGEIWWPDAEARDGHDRRPIMVAFSHCQHILIEGVTIRNSPNFVFCPTGCSDLIMNGVTIFNEWWAQNGDGIDISACKNVVVYKCTVSAGDDGICMKSSGRSPSGAPALENVIVAGCTVYHAHGGFVIGSNTDGGMQHIAVSDCSFIGTDVGLRFKSSMGRGGLVKDIFIHDIFMRDIVNEAVLFDTYYENITAGSTRDPNAGAATDKIPEFRDFRISRVYCNGAHSAIVLTGLPQMPVSHIDFDSLVISSQKGLVATQARQVGLHAVQLITKEQPVYQADSTADIRVRNF